MPELWALVIASVLATYSWRGFGVLLSGRISVNSELFNWIVCVAYAMLAGLVSRMLFMPSGMLAQTVLVDRLAACALALIVYRFSGRNILLAIASGVGTITAGALIRGA